MKLEFIGAAHEVTGSCHYIEWNDRHILLDCGMEQGEDIYENQELPVDPSLIDYIFLSHAHIDHSGLLPLMYKNGFRGQIYCTQATFELSQIMLKDSAFIQEQEAEWKNRKAQRSGKPEVIPLYTVMDAEGVLDHFASVPYGNKVSITEGLSVRFINAGHLLGSAIIELFLMEDEKETKIAFTGDLGPGNRPLIKDPEYIESCDYLIVESTYGNRTHSTPPDYAPLLKDVIKRTFDRGGNVVIPAFSVGRTQEMLYHINRIMENDMLPEYPVFDVYVDSPMAIEATKVFHNSVKECFNEVARKMITEGINPIIFPGLKTTVSSDESKLINMSNKPSVIISASGMCEAGRIRHHLKHNLWRPESTILFVGYQVPGTLGNKLLNGAEQVTLFGEKIEVRAEIINLPGISGHADMNQILDWIKHIKEPPKRIFVVHGEDATTDEFAKLITSETKFPAIAPYSGDMYDLDLNVLVEAGARKRFKKPEKQVAVSKAYARLLEVANRLIKLVKSYQERPNKDSTKFANEIENLCNKYE